MILSKICNYHYEGKFIKILNILFIGSLVDTTREENEIRRDVNSELLYTSNLVDDTYDLAAKSRNRDQMLLREATRALVSIRFFFLLI